MFIRIVFICTQYITVFLTLLNCLTVRGVTLVQNLFTIAKLAALALIIVTGIVLLCIGGRKFICKLITERLLS